MTCAGLVAASTVCLDRLKLTGIAMRRVAIGLIVCGAVLGVGLCASTRVFAAEPAPRSTLTVNRALERAWQRTRIQPVEEADTATLLRRLMLDLTGRVPTVAEMAAFAEDRTSERYAETVRRLVGGAEFEWYFATVLDEMIQGRHAGNEGFVDYLRRALRERKGWDRIFREVLIGPWNTPDRKAAVAFLDRRARDLDVLTVDVARSFFGVDVSCARCHDHPLVRDWKQDHYYGMAAFFARTSGGKGTVTEKAEGEARFAGKDGKERVAPMMFVTGRIVESPRKTGEKKTPAFNRREALVQVALEEKTFLARAFVNRVWEYFLGRGLVSPVDQMHSGNPASVPGLLDTLAAEFVEEGYDVRKLVTAIVLSRPYRLASRWSGRGAPPDEGQFAVARLRPLTPRQLARSLVVAVGEGSFDGSSAQLAALDKLAAPMLSVFDPRTTEFQSSTREALFVSNAEMVRKLIAAEGTNLTGRLAGMKDEAAIVRRAVAVVYSRVATEEETTELLAWLRKQPNRRAACEDLVWALVASAEFRFNH